MNMMTLPDSLAAVQPALDALTRRSKTLSNPPTKQDEIEMKSLFHDLERAVLQLNTSLEHHHPLT